MREKIEERDREERWEQKEKKVEKAGIYRRRIDPRFVHFLLFLSSFFHVLGLHLLTNFPLTCLSKVMPIRWVLQTVPLRHLTRVNQMTHLCSCQYALIQCIHGYRDIGRFLHLYMKREDHKCECHQNIHWTLTWKTKSPFKNFQQ